ncbi:MAG TPA: MFS transporter [Candidatus Binatia bacterium]|nr:MFS transporter [Candidatus Binatia bacterium]
MPTAETYAAPTPARALTYAAYISFVPIGIATVLLGPMLPILSARWSMNDSQAGALFNAQYFASTGAVALSGMLVMRWGYRFAISFGLSLMALGVALLLWGPKIVGVLCIAAYGAGLGLAVPAGNLLVAAANPERRSASLNVLNFYWSMGAVACPFLVAAAAESQRIPLFLFVVALFALMVAIGIALMRGKVAEPTTARDKAPPLPTILSHKYPFAILAALFLLYVGVENAFGQWIASYVKSLGTLTLAVALATPSFFYSSLMLGRWFAPALLRLIDEVRLVQGGLLLACAGMAGLTFSHGIPTIAASAIAAGFGLSSVYPITISLLSRKFASTKVGSLMFVLSNIGGGLLPWMVGIISTRFGALKSGLYVPLLGCLGMYCLYLQNWTRSNPASYDSPAQPHDPH